MHALFAFCEVNLSVRKKTKILKDTKIKKLDFQKFVIRGIIKNSVCYIKKLTIPNLIQFPLLYLLSFEDVYEIL